MFAVTTWLLLIWVNLEGTWFSSQVDAEYYSEEACDAAGEEMEPLVFEFLQGKYGPRMRSVDHSCEGPYEDM